MAGKKKPHRRSLTNSTVPTTGDAIAAHAIDQATDQAHRKKADKAAHRVQVLEVFAGQALVELQVGGDVRHDRKARDHRQHHQQQRALHLGPT
jgi:hypothetical protein